MTTVSKVNFPNVLTSAQFSTATQKEMAKNIGDNAMAGVMKTPAILAADTVDISSVKLKNVKPQPVNTLSSEATVKKINTVVKDFNAEYKTALPEANVKNIAGTAKKSLTKGAKAGIAVAAAAAIAIGGFVANKIMKAKNNEQTKA